jgi:hypothetical protein
MARRLTAHADMTLGDTTFEGSILIDGEVPAGLAQLLKEVHKEGVTVMHLAEQQEKQQAETANSDAILVHLQRLQEVLTSKDSNETIVGLFKDFEQNITSDRENMLKEIKKFALKVENTAADSNMFNPTLNNVNADPENNNVGEIVNRLENIAMKLQEADSRNSNPNTPRKGPNVEMINQFQQVSPNRVVSMEDYNMLQTRFAHLQQRMEAISLAKPDEQTILESFRQRIVSILANINILMTTPVSNTSLTELDQSRMEVNSVFEELQKFNILSLVNSSTQGFGDSVLSSSNDYLKKCNKELTDRCCLIENKARRIAGSVSDLENNIRNYQKKCHDLKNKAKNSTFQANTLYNKLVRSDQYKRALGFQKRYFLMRLESESTKIDLAMQIVSDLINDLPDYMRNKYSNQFTIIKRGLSNGRSPGKNSSAFNKPALSKYSSTRQLNSGLTDQAKKRRARRNWRVLIITARATARMRILCRRSVRTKVCADQKFNLSQFEDEDDLIYDFDLNFDQKLNFQHVQMQQSPHSNISPRQHINSPMQHQGYQTLQNPLRSPLQNMRSPPNFQRSNSEQVGNGFAVPVSPATSFGNQNAFGGSMVVHHQSPVNRQLFSSHSALNNMPNTSNATTVTPLRETGGLREAVIQADWARHRGNSAGLDDGRGLVSQNSTPGRLSTGLADYQNISSHHYSNSNLAQQPFTPTTNATYTNLQNFPNSYSAQNF